MNRHHSASSSLGNRMILLVLSLSTACIIGLAIFHTYELYSPVPVWDMWVGYLDFYQKVSRGEWSIWWAPHNEHRIVLGRLLFWADIHWFRGASVFLLVCNYVFIACTALMFWRILGERIPGEEFRTTRITLGLVVTAWLYLLCQRENIIWGFQGVFILAFLLPLCALYWLQKSITNGSTADYLLACGFGLLACGSMANGTLALPLMTAFGLLTRQRRLRTGILLCLSLALTGLYFHGFGPSHSSLAAHMGTATAFSLTLIGSPFYYLTDSYGPSVAFAFGCIFVLATSYKAVLLLRRPRRDLLQTSLLFFLVYVGASALAITSGRMFLGLSLALTFHYTTTAIVGWAALLTLYSADITVIRGLRQGWVAAGAVALAALMIHCQITFLGRYVNFYFQQRLATLSLALGIRDQHIVQSLGDPATAFSLISPIAEKAYNQHLSVFGAYPYRDAEEQLGKPALIASRFSQVCQGSLETAEITTDPRFVKIGGWIVNPDKTKEPTTVRIVSDTGAEIGYAITGRDPDLAKTLGTGMFFPGYGGYVSARAAGQQVLLQGENRLGIVCHMTAVMPTLLYSLKAIGNTAAEVSVANDSVLPGGNWTSSDFNHTNFSRLGLRVYGTYDEPDVRSISLRLKRGDRFLFRAGQTGGKEFIEVSGQPEVLLPVATEWVVLELSSPAMPTQPTLVKLTDRGTEPQEWSAIAVRDVK